MLRPPPAFIPPNSWKIKAGPRASVLAQWRGINLEEQEKAQAQSAKTIGAVMPAVLRQIGVDRRQSELEILKVWQNLMDPLVVAHAQPSGLVRGTLFITVDSNVWLAEILRYRKREILQRLHHSFGRDLIQKLSFRVG